MTQATVVVGGSVAGIRVARLLRRGGHRDPVVVVEAESGDPYDKPALSKDVLTAPGAAPPLLGTAADLAAAGIEFRTGSAVALDVAARAVVLADGDALGFRRLVIATGASPRRLRALDGLAGVHHLRSRTDAAALAAALDARPRVVVVGGGFIGLEVAAAARARGLAVTVVEAAGELAQRVMPAEVGRALRHLHEEQGVVVRRGSTVVGARGAGRVEAVELADGTWLPADLVVVGIGAVPNTGWLAGSSLSVADGVVCTERLRVVGADDVWAAGDVARWLNPRYGVLQRAEHWTAAREHASVVAADVLGADPPGCDTLPYVWSDQYDVHVQHVGVVPPGARTQATPARSGAGTLFTHVDLDGRVTGATAIDAPFDLLQVRRALTRGPARLDAVMVTG